MRTIPAFATLALLAALFPTDRVAAQSSPINFGPYELTWSDYVPEEPCCPRDCSVTDSGVPSSSACAPCEETGSVFFSLSLGRASFARKTDLVRSALLPTVIAPRPGFPYLASTSGMAHRVKRFEDIKNHYQRSPLTARRDYRLWIAQDNIDTGTYLPSALVADPEALSWKATTSGGAIRQILTDDVLADIQDLSAVRSTLPSDIEGALPTASEGFVIRTWFESDKGSLNSGTGLYDLSTTVAPLSYVVFYNPDATSHNGRLNIIHKAKFNSTTYKTRSFCHSQDTTTHDWTSTWNAGLPSDTIIRQTELDVTSWTNSRDFTRTRTVKERALSPSGSYGSLQTVSVTSENFDDIGGTSRLVEEIHGFGSGAERTTKYGYYANSADTATLGRLMWRSEHDGWFEHFTYTFDPVTPTASIVRKTPWKGYKWTPGSTVPTTANCLIETSYMNQTDLSVTTSVGGSSNVVAYESEVWGTASDGAVTNTRSVNYDGSSALVTVTGYYPNSAAAHLKNKIKWRELPDGTAEGYSYTAPATTGNIGEYTQTVETGAGSRTGVTKGIRVVSTRNKQGFITEEHTWHFDGSTALEMMMWSHDGLDYFGRPIKRVWNATATDYDETIQGCCGIASFRDRKGILTEYFQDDLKRVRKVTTTAGTNVTSVNTDFNGLVTTVTKTGGSLTVLVSKTWKYLNGEVDKVHTPDQDNAVRSGTSEYPEETTYAFSYPGTGGKIVSQVNPDGGTEVTEYFIDRRIKSVTGSAVHDTAYDYDTHTLRDNGLVTKITRLTSTGGTGEWVNHYYDRAGRLFKTEYPTDIKVASTLDHSLVDYYPASAAAGARGKQSQTTDPDGVVVSYVYDSEGNVASKTETMPNSAGSRTTAFNHGVVADGILGPCYSVETEVNSTSILTSLTAADGLGSGTITLGGTTRSVTVLGGPTMTWTAGSWSEITTRPDGTRLSREYVDGRLATEEHRDNTGAAGAVIASTAYEYDDLGLLDSTTDSRTGTTYKGPYTESGNLLSQADSAARTTAWKYDVMGRVIEVDGEDTLDASSNTVYNKSYTSYLYDGSVSARWGDQGYTVSYAYDEQGRMKEMRTYRSLAHNQNPLTQTPVVDAGDATTWTYDNQRGWLTDKDDASSKGPHYTYTAAGRLKTRTWARGAHTRYSYDQGMLSAVDYFTSSAATTSDALTPNLGYTYDAKGRLTVVTRGGATHFTYTYSSTDLGVQTETQNDAIVQQRVLTRKRDAYLRPTGYKLGTTSVDNAIHEVTYAYDAAGRFSSVTYQRVPAATMPPPPPSQTFTYDYEYEVASASHVRHVSGTAKPSFIPFGMDGPQHSVTRMYHATRDALQSISNRAGVNNLSTFDYNYNAIGQREGVGLSSDLPASSEWVSLGYDANGQVVSADSSAGTGTSDDRYYSYDQIGNRIQSRTGTATSTGGTATTSYYADAGATSSGASALNQYGSIVTGVNAADPVYDDDGNLVDDGAAWEYAWDAENRMISATPKVPTSGSKVEYAYDHMGRLCTRRHFSWNAGTSSWGNYENYRYVYDGWNRIESRLDWNLLQDEYVWGLDMSGSLQDAGGVGGMLQWITSYDYGNLGSWDNYYPLYDGNGNVTELIDDVGDIAAHWEYDPFGNTVRSTTAGAWSDPVNLFEFRFSTKPQDRRTGLYYYGYRFYDSLRGRWLNKDPLGPTGGVNTYAFGHNDAINIWDFLGLQEGETEPCRVYEANAGKHGETAKQGGYISPEPSDGAKALQDSLPVKDGQRIYIDPDTGEVNVLRRHIPTGEGQCCEKWHGYQVKWDDLVQEQKNVLIKGKKTNVRGKPMKPPAPEPAPPRPTPGTTEPGGIRPTPPPEPVPGRPPVPVEPPPPSRPLPTEPPPPSGIRPSGGGALMIFDVWLTIRWIYTPTEGYYQNGIHYKWYGEYAIPDGVGPS